MISSVNSVNSMTSFRGAEVDVAGALTTLGEIGKVAEGFSGDSASFSAAENVMNKIGDNTKNPVVSKAFKIGGSIAGLVVGIFAYKKIVDKAPQFVGNLIKKVQGKEPVKVTGAMLDEIAAKNSENLNKFLGRFNILKKNPRVLDGIHGTLTTLGLNSPKNAATTVAATAAAVATEKGVIKFADSGDSKKQAEELNGLIEDLEEQLSGSNAKQEIAEDTEDAA